MYTMAADHYDKVGELEQADIYRQKIQMLFIKPHVMACFSGGGGSTKQTQESKPKKQIEEPKPSPIVKQPEETKVSQPANADKNRS